MTFKLDVCIHTKNGKLINFLLLHWLIKFIHHNSSTAITIIDFMIELHIYYELIIVTALLLLLCMKI